MSIKWSDFIVPTVHDNTDSTFNHGNKKFNTKDLVYIKSYPEVDSQPLLFKRKSLTDFALMCGAPQVIDTFTKTGKASGAYWLRSVIFKNMAMTIEDTGYDCFENYIDEELGVCPSMRLDAEKIVMALKLYPDLFKITEIKDKKGNSLYHTLDFGEYPKTKAVDNIQRILNNLENDNCLQYTGKEYNCYIDPTYGEMVTAKEIQYNGDKYVKVRVNAYDKILLYSDNSAIDFTNENVWVKVEPIRHIIENWSSLLPALNPNGNGKSKTINLTTEEIIKVGQFYPNLEHNNCYYWQNSSIRGDLNGINVNNLSKDGLLLFNAAKAGGNFEGKGFFNEAYGEIEFLKNTEARQNKILELIKEDIGFIAKIPPAIASNDTFMDKVYEAAKENCNNYVDSLIESENPIACVKVFERMRQAGKLIAMKKKQVELLQKQLGKAKKTRSKEEQLKHDVDLYFDRLKRED